MPRVRHVHGGAEPHTEIVTIDQMDRRSHAYHQYRIHLPGQVKLGRFAPCAAIDFQRGPRGEVGVNGCANEDLLAIVADRLKCLQEGELKCGYHAVALEHIEAALTSLHKRTAHRQRRGVEGTGKA